MKKVLFVSALFLSVSLLRAERAEAVKVEAKKVVLDTYTGATPSGASLPLIVRRGAGIKPRGYIAFSLKQNLENVQVAFSVGLRGKYTVTNSVTQTGHFQFPLKLSDFTFYLNYNRSSEGEAIQDSWIEGEGITDFSYRFQMGNTNVTVLGPKVAPYDIDGETEPTYIYTIQVALPYRLKRSVEGQNATISITAEPNRRIVVDQSTVFLPLAYVDSAKTKAEKGTFHVGLYYVGSSTPGYDTGFFRVIGTPFKGLPKVTMPALDIERWDDVFGANVYVYWAAEPFWSDIFTLQTRVPGWDWEDVALGGSYIYFDDWSGKNEYDGYEFFGEQEYRLVPNPSAKP